VSFGLQGLHVESDPVVAEHQLHLVALLRDRDPDVRGVRVLERVRHPFASVVVQEQGDRRRDLDLPDVRVEPDVGLPPDLGEEAVDRLLETGSPER
jgi:hypothetical protein